MSFKSIKEKMSKLTQLKKKKMSWACGISATQKVELGRLRQAQAKSYRDPNLKNKLSMVVHTYNPSYLKRWR
jgi:hypothetical protein